MRLNELLAGGRRTFSFEFFPPKTPEAAVTLLRHAGELARLKPAFVSVTYGAGGSTRERTLELVANLQAKAGLNSAAHLTCVGHSRAELAAILDTLRARGVANLIALRGDPPADKKDFVPHPDGLTHANELVALIRERHGDAFGIAVAGYPEKHPEAPDEDTDLANLKRKVDAGADAVITQLFFDNADFLRFRDRCAAAGIRIPVLAGIMPVVSKKGVLRMTSLCGAKIPPGLHERLDQAGDDDAEVEKIGTDWATEQCRGLLASGVRGLHFYSLNRSGATVEIFRRLGEQ